MQPTFPMISFFKKTYCSIFLIFSTAALFSQAVSVVPDRANANYATGETITFNVTSNFGGGQVTWVLKYDNNTSEISSGSFNLNSNQTQTVTYTPTEPGVIFCEVSKNGQNATAAVAVSPYGIQPLEPEPSDFDAFWNIKKAELAAIPMNAQVTFLSNNAYSTTYRLTLDIIDGRKMYGYIVVPDGPGSFPTILTLPPYGATPNIAMPEVHMAETTGVLAISLGIHNAPPNQTDPNAYQPDDYADKDGNYYKYAILGAIRAIDYVFTRNDFDGENVGLTGVSQGAGLSMIVAGLDDRVKLQAISNPILCQNAGLKHGRASGFPNYLLRSQTEVGTQAHFNATTDATRYYDAMFFSKRFNGVTLAIVSYKDLTTPAATSLAAFNQLGGTKILLHGIDLFHTHPSEFWNGRYNFIRRYFPSTLTNHPFPYSPDTEGYFIDAGSDATINSNSTNLNGTIESENNVNPNFNLFWEKISGPGSVSFSNPNSYNTTVTFGGDGTYILQLSAVDEGLLSTQKKFYTLFDQVTVNVNSGGGNNDTTPPEAMLSTASNNVDAPFNVVLSFSEEIVGLELSDLGITNGVAFDLMGSGDLYSFTVEPIAAGEVMIALPAFRVQDLAGNANTNGSNILSVFYDPSNSGGGDCNTPTNLALGKNTTQHSTQFGASASRANDGNTDGNFWGSNSVSLTNWVNNAWWEIDLEEVSEIQEIKIWNRSDCCSGALSNFHVLVSENPFSSTNLNSTLNQPGVTNFYISATAGFPTSLAVNQNGRYVRIQLAGQGFLALAEVEILGCPTGNGGGTGGTCDAGSTSNLAPQGAATQSSTQFNASASRAIDGNTNGNFWNNEQSVSLTNWEFNAWWEIDLGAVANIEEVKIWNRADCCASVLSNYHVLISETPFVSTDLNSTINQAGVLDFYQNNQAARPTDVTVDQKGRYIRIQLAEQGFLALAEVEVIGCIPNNANGNPTTLLTLPEALIHFDAKKTGSMVTLDWITHTEFLNDFFVIEKSFDGIHFENLAKVDSRSESHSAVFYQEKDFEPYDGKNFYRLKLTLKDSSEIFSNIKNVNFNQSLDNISIFPNPAQEQLSVLLQPFMGKQALIQIFDARGILMDEKNYATIDEPMYILDLEKYINGLYTISLKIENTNRISKSFVVEKLD